MEFSLKIKAIADERGYDEILEGTVNVPRDTDVTGGEERACNRKISMIFPLVSCCSCVNNPSSS